ncbi:hypothetical protein OCU04_009577 [Sclerotinia nivalis]|uniref:Tyrosinase copper-binding domain-containing protein n=1 Tax=Sclerotinia nivalis TaxID=352851 RepID=A0A9X0AFE6_9HELO|nr:hypothetical protein OCU04_009577 [Sclerotinia nivalis]
MYNFSAIPLAMKVCDHSLIDTASVTQSKNDKKVVRRQGSALPSTTQAVARNTFFCFVFFVEETLSKPDYTSFSSSLEDSAHITSSIGRKGDFGTFTAPYNPIFFLHHAQIDRLWWLW